MGKLKVLPIIGTKYGNWEVISDEIFKKSTNRSSYFKVKCICGNTQLKESHHLNNGKAIQCKSCARRLKFENCFALAYFNIVKSRAIKAKLEHNVTPEFLYNLFKEQNEKCKLSGVELTFGDYGKTTKITASLDRIDSSKGYIESNVQWIHKDINFMKRTMSDETLIEWCKKITNHQNNLVVKK